MENQSEVVDAVMFRDLGISRRSAGRSPLAALSVRELDVVQELVDGHSTDAAAARLYISRHTFRTHLKNISRKLDTHSSLETVSLAVEHGMRPSRLVA
jgi:DNA-binding CsgD family transcriptional regulator